MSGCHQYVNIVDTIYSYIAYRIYKAQEFNKYETGKYQTTTKWTVYLATMQTSEPLIAFVVTQISKYEVHRSDHRQLCISIS